MSCNGCRVLRKGCSDSCILRPCLQWIETSDAQGHATVFVAKFFGRAGLMGFISAVPESQRPALFQSLLYEACGRTVNPVFGAVGLLWAGNWQACQAAVDTVLKGGSLHPPSPSTLSSYSLPSSLPPAHLSHMPRVALGKSAAPRECLMTFLPHSPSEPVKDVRLKVGPPEANLLQAAGQDLRDHPNAARGDADRGNTRHWQDWHQHRILQGNVPHHNTSPGAVKGGLCSNNQRGSGLESKADQYGLSAQSSQPGQTNVYVAHIGAPVPRRVRPRLTTEFVTLERPMARGGSQEELEATVAATGMEQLELDLTLEVKGVKEGQAVGTKRLSSPSCESVNSEGSVTSLDSTPDPSMPSWPLQIGAFAAPHHLELPKFLFSTSGDKEVISALNVQRGDGEGDQKYGQRT